MAANAIDAGAVYVAPEAGVVSDTAGGWFAVGFVTLTLEKRAVVRAPALWLVTASPTYAVVPSAIDCERINVQLLPLVDE